MTLRIHISSHDDHVHNTTAKKDVPGGVAGIDTNKDFNDFYLTVTKFKENPGTGDFDNPENANDSDTNTISSTDTSLKHIQFDFGKRMLVGEFRYFGDANQNRDGNFVIFYHSTDRWVLLDGYYSTRIQSWSTWIEFPRMLIIDKIAIYSWLIDTQGSNIIREIEMRG